MKAMEQAISQLLLMEELDVSIVKNHLEMPITLRIILTRNLSMNSSLRIWGRFMSENSEQFYSRSYWGDKKILVYPLKRNVGKCEIWTLEQAKQYVNYLERQDLQK